VAGLSVYHIMFLALIILPLVSLTLGNEDICWESCQDQNPVESVSILGCHRRSTYPHKENFRCEGAKGPPCTTRKEETITFNLAFSHSGLDPGSLTQTAWASLSPFLPDVPWITMEPQGCQYLNTTGGGVGCTGEPGTSHLSLPILVENNFPASFYTVKYYLSHRGKQILCVRFPLRICYVDQC